MLDIDCSWKDLSGPFGRYDGFALIVVGLVLIIVAAVRFVRTGRRLDDQEMHSAGSIRAELILSATLALIVAGFSTFPRLISRGEISRRFRCKNPVASREGLNRVSGSCIKAEQAVDEARLGFQQIASIHGANWPFLNIASPRTH